MVAEYLMWIAVFYLLPPLFFATLVAVGTSVRDQTPLKAQVRPFLVAFMASGVALLVVLYLMATVAAGSRL